MPQPFKGPYLDYSLDALSQRPELAKHIGIIASMWAYLESRLADLFGAMLKADKQAGILMFAQIKSEPARLAVMQAVAEDRLDPAQAAHFITLKKKISNTGGQRDRVVHGLWGIPTKKPQSIVWIDPRGASILNATMDVTRRKLSRMTNRDLNKLMKIWTKHEEGMYEYTERDFVDIENNILKRLEEIKWFDGQVWWIHDRRHIWLRGRR